MKVTSIIFLFLFFNNFHTIAQSDEWAPVGAKWWFTKESVSSLGYIKISYVGDTIIENISCKRFDKIHYFYNFQSEKHDTTFLGHEFTYMDDNENKVYYYLNNEFYILYDFNAQVGDVWDLTPEGDYQGAVKVDSTGVMDINGESRKYLYVSPVDSSCISFYPKNMKIIEKYGYMGYMFPELVDCVMDATEGGKLRCYQDNTGDFFETGTEVSCDYTVSINDFHSDISVNIYPNPAKDQITIDVSKISSSNTHVQIYDMQGRTVFSKSFNEQVININTVNYHSGMYMLDIRQANDVFKSKIYVE